MLWMELNSYSYEVQHINDILGNQPPIAFVDSISTNGSTQVSINVIINEIYHDDNLDPLTEAIFSYLANCILVNNYDCNVHTSIRVLRE